MATRRYSIDPETDEFSIVEAAGAAVATKNIELTVNLANNIVTDLNDPTGARTISKAEVLLALEKLENYIVKGNWPPA